MSTRAVATETIVVADAAVAVPLKADVAPPPKAGKGSLLLLSLLCNALLLCALLLDASRIADDDARGDDDGVAWEAAAPARPESDGGLAPALAALLSLRALRRLAR